MEINKIYCEDCLDTMKRMPDNFIDLTVTSPPYDNLRNYNGFSFDFENIAKELFRVTKKGGVVVWVVGDATINGSESLMSFKQAIYFVESVGFYMNDSMIYKKKNPIPIVSGCRYNPSFEFMFCISKGKPKTFNPIMLDKQWKEFRTIKQYSKNIDGIKTKGKVSDSDKFLHPNIFEYTVGGGHVTDDDIAYKHPAIYPEKLVNDQILSWSNE